MGQGSEPFFPVSSPRKESGERMLSRDLHLTKGATLFSPCPLLPWLFSPAFAFISSVLSRDSSSGPSGLGSLDPGGALQFFASSPANARLSHALPKSHVSPAVLFPSTAVSGHIGADGDVELRVGGGILCEFDLEPSFSVLFRVISCEGRRNCARANVQKSVQPAGVSSEESTRYPA